MSKGLIFRLKKEEEQKQQVAETPSLAEGDGSQVKREEETTASESGIKEIILKGPIGYAFTDVLNKLLCRKDNRSGVIRTESFRTESMSQLLITNIEAENQAEIEEKPDRAFIYVNDGRKMNLGEVQNLLEEVEKKRDTLGEKGYIGVVIEGMGEVVDAGGPKANHLSNAVLHMEHHCGVVIMYSYPRLKTAISRLLGI